MTVWGAAAVEAAAGGAAGRGAAAGGGRLHVGPRDVVTPLARERARDLGVEIVVGSAVPAATPSPTAAPQPGVAVARQGPAGRARPGYSTAAPEPPARDGAGRSGTSAPAPGLPPRAGTSRQGAAAATPGRSLRPPSGALYRRGAPLPTFVRGGGRTGRVAVVGAGNVGTIAGLRLVEADVFDEVVLVDVDQGRAAGIALDLAHTAALAGFVTGVRGVGTVEAAGPADYVVITAGRPRQPGMSRTDLIGTNAAIVGDVAERVAATSPHAVLVVVTNPLDEMTQHAWFRSGFPASRVLGMAGVLDTARFQALTALTGVGRADAISAWALGSHGEEMVIPLSQAAVDGRPLGDVVPDDRLRAAVDRTRGSGAEVVGLLAKGSAFLAPGLSAARMVLAMAADTGAVMPAAVLADGAYGISDVYVGLPVRLGRSGVREIVVLDLLPDELAALRAAADRIRERLGQLAAAS